MEFTSNALSDNVHEFTFQCEYTDTIPTLVISDVHYDSLKCKRKLLKKHLDQAVEKGAAIFIIGDWFDVMATYGDRRQKREDVDPRYIKRGRSYIDLVIEDSVEFLKPYAKNIALFSYGNHETTLIKFHDTDVIRRIVGMLNDKTGSNIQLGAYSGFYMIKAFYKNGNGFARLIGHYHHGFGGNAKRSKGMLDVQIEAMKYPDAKILLRGHTHQKWYDPSTTRVKVNKAGRIYKDALHYLMTGSYKDGIEDGKFGWEVQKNFMPTRMGGWWVDYLFHQENGIGIQCYEAH